MIEGARLAAVHTLIDVLSLAEVMYDDDLRADILDAIAHILERPCRAMKAGDRELLNEWHRVESGVVPVQYVGEFDLSGRGVYHRLDLGDEPQEADVAAVVNRVVIDTIVAAIIASVVMLVVWAVVAFG